MTNEMTLATILDVLSAGQHFRAASGPLTSQVTIQGQACIAIGYDNGNDAAKLALLTDHGRMVALRVPTAYRSAQTIRGGAGLTTYQHDDGAPFWIGAAALEHDGDALPIGPTPQRLNDLRQRAFIAAALGEGLLAAGYPPGSYDLALGFAIPNAEIVRETQGDKLGVAEPTRQALKALRGVAQTIRRTDSRGRVGEWVLTLHQLIPQAQSIGTFLAWSRTPTGSTVTDIEALTVIDIGGGDLQRTDISVNPYRMASQHLGAGTIGIARALAAAFPQLSLNDVRAQQALVSRAVRIAGRQQDITAQVDATIATHGQDLIGRLLPALQQTSRYVLITGGGAVLLRDLLSARAAAIGKAQPHDYALIAPEQAATLNAVGALFAVIFAAAKRA
jgi:hypothetical protein